jgi:hypothetical protein
LLSIRVSRHFYQPISGRQQAVRYRAPATARDGRLSCSTTTGLDRVFHDRGDRLGKQQPVSDLMAPVR